MARRLSTGRKPDCVNYKLLGNCDAGEKCSFRHDVNLADRYTVRAREGPDFRTETAFHGPCFHSCNISSSLLFMVSAHAYIATFRRCTVVSKNCCLKAKAGAVSENPLLSGNPLPYLVCAQKVNQ